MGYNVITSAINVTIPAGKVQACYEALCALNARDDLKIGTRRPNPTPKPADSKSVASSPDKWFSWMPWNYDETCKTLQDIWEEVGFDCVKNADGSVSLEFYDGKTGCERTFLREAAPYIKPGSYVVWAGDDGDVWADIFDRTGVMRVVDVIDLVAQQAEVREW